MKNSVQYARKIRRDENQILMFTVLVLLHLKFVYSEKATKFCEISTLLLSTVHTDKSKVEISQNFVAFSEYMNFKFLSKDMDGPKISEKINPELGLTSASGNRYSLM